MKWLSITAVAVPGGTEIGSKNGGPAHRSTNRDQNKVKPCVKGDAGIVASSSVIVAAWPFVFPFP